MRTKESKESTRVSSNTSRNQSWYFKIFSPHQRHSCQTFRRSSLAVHLNILVFITFAVLIVNSVVFFFDFSTGRHFEECARKDELHYRMFSLCEMYSGKHFCRYRRYQNFQWFPLTKYTVAAVATVAEIEIFLSQRRSSLLSYLSLLSLKSMFPYIATVAETRFSTTAAIVATGAIIWKPGLKKRDTRGTPKIR